MLRGRNQAERLPCFYKDLNSFGSRVVTPPYLNQLMTTFEITLEFHKITPVLYFQELNFKAIL